MSDVAALAGVSKMTVSRVLAGRGVAPATRERVQQAIDALGYVADAAAGALSSGRSAFAAVLVPSLASSNFSDTVRGLTAALEPQGLQLLIGDTDYDLDREERLVRLEIPQQYAGRVRVGDAASVEDDPATGRTWQGTVQRLSEWITRRRSRSLEPFELNDVHTLEALIRIHPEPNDVRIGQRVLVRITPGVRTAP